MSRLTYSENPIKIGNKRLHIILYCRFIFFSRNLPWSAFGDISPGEEENSIIKREEIFRNE